MVLICLLRYHPWKAGRNQCNSRCNPAITRGEHTVIKYSVNFVSNPKRSMFRDDYIIGIPSPPSPTSDRFGDQVCTSCGPWTSTLWLNIVRGLKWSFSLQRPIFYLLKVWYIEQNHTFIIAVLLYLYLSGDSSSSRCTFQCTCKS